MTRYRLNGLKVPYPKQMAIMDVLFHPSPHEVKQVDVAAGRGFGKTMFAIAVAIRALTRKDRQCGLFLEPDIFRMNNVFLKLWRDIVPSQLYVENKTERTVTMVDTGSVLYYGPRAITGSTTSVQDKYKGLNLHFVIDDEAAMGADRKQYNNTLAAIRLPSDVRFYFTISTPKVGIYKEIVTSPRHRLFHGKSSDNPYLPAGFVENLLENMGPEEAQRELNGEFVSLEGAIWKNVDLEKNWPDGNIDTIWPAFKPGEPWILACDIGSATGAYVVLQRRDSRNLFTGSVWVAVADLCPKIDASAARAFQILKDHFGSPAAISAGADINTSNSADGRTVAYFANQVFGYSPRIYPCSEDIFNKQLQYDKLSYLVCSSTRQRRFTVAKNFVALDPYSRRGVIEMFKEDEWPDERKRRATDFLPKNKEIKVQHVRDALMMCAASILSPPDWAPKKEYAA